MTEQKESDVGRATLIPALLLCGLLAGGCSKEESAKPKVAEPPPAPPAKPPSKEPVPKQEEPKAKGPAEPAQSDEEFDAALEGILRLEQDGQFSEAMQLCRGASSRFRGHPKAAALLEVSARLRDERKAAARLSFAIRQLTSGQPEAAEVARRELLEAGDAALILLRKTLRDDSGDAAVQAASILAQARDKRAPQAFVATLLLDPPAPLRAALCDGLKALSDLADQDVFSALYAVVRDDAACRNWDIAALLCAALDTRCGGDDAKLGELLGDRGAATTLKAYVARAIDSADAPAADWARSVAPAAGVVVNGLRGSYFEGASFEKLLVERLDTWVNFTEVTLPFPKGKVSGISARWTGYLLVKRASNYMIAAEYDDGLRLWIDGKLILEDWAGQGPGEQQASVTLRKGFHELKLEYTNAEGQARIKLSWDGPGFSRRAIAGDAFRTLPWKGMQER